MAKKVLIIDDEKDMRVYLKTLLAKAGFDTDTADNGEEGLRKARAAPPDLITLDVLMPKKSGIRAYGDLRSAIETAQVPIIILTGLVKREDFFGDEPGDVPGPDAIVEKPIDRETFIRLVRKLTGG